MSDVNFVAQLGRLAADPEISYTKRGTPVVEFTIVTNRHFKDSAGEQKQEAAFIDGKMFGPRAETFNQYMAKGRKVFIQGRLAEERWQTKEGANRRKVVLVAEDFDFVEGPRKQEAAGV